MSGSDCAHFDYEDLKKERDTLNGLLTKAVEERAQALNERDRLKAELENQKKMNIDYFAADIVKDRDRLKAELEITRNERNEYFKDIGDWTQDRDLWKSRAEKLAETLRGCLNWMGPVMDGFKLSKTSEAYKGLIRSKKALSDFEAGK